MIVQVSLVLNNGYCRTVTDVLTVNSVVLPVTGFHGFYLTGTLCDRDRNSINQIK